MKLLLKLKDVHDPRVVIQSELSYEYLSDAIKEHFKNEQDGSIMLTINNEATHGIDASLEITVEDAEKLAFHILGMCAAVKGSS